MKKLNLILIFVCITVAIKAQDTIKFTNGNVIVAKILEINPTTIKYKPLNNLDGPDYIDEKKRINFIKFANGVVDSLNAVVVEPVQNIQSIPTLTPLPPQFNKIGSIGSRYFFVDANNQRIGRGIGINKILKTANAMANEKKIQPLTDLAKKTNNNKKMQTVFGIVGAPVILVGLATTLTGLIISDSAFNSSEQADGENLALVGATITTIGIGFEITSIVNGITKKKRLKQTIDLYNQNL